MQINRLTLAKGILSITAISMMTGCVDDKYDLSDLDTTSQFTVKDLTIPVELETIKLENVIDIADNDSTIKKDTLNKGTTNEKIIYSIEKRGHIDPTSFSLGSVDVAQVPINSVEVNVGIPSDIPSGIILPIPIKNKSLDLNLIDEKGENKGLQSYNFNLNNIDKALVSIDKIETTPISIEVELSIPDGLMDGDNSISFTDIAIKLPKGLIGVTNNANGKYFADKDSLAIDNLPVDNTGKAHLSISANGLSLGERGIIKIDEKGNHYLDISGEIGLESAKILLNVSQIVIPDPFTIDINYSVSGFSVQKFSGKIDYDMDDIKIEPISLNDLPDFLDNPKTSIVIDDPVILVTLVNPVGEYGLTGHGTLNITSIFKNNESNETNDSCKYHGAFTLSGNESKLAFCAKEKGKSIPSGYTKIEIPGLDRILTNGNNGLPKTIEVSVSDLKFDGTVTNLPLANLGDASGTYSFSAPLALGKDTKIIYTTTETGWGSDDLDKVNIYLINLSAVCTSNLPVNASIKIIPIDKNGDAIPVDENKPLNITANTTGEPIGLNIQGTMGKDGKRLPIKDFDGIMIEATVTQTSDNAEALGPNLEISLSKVQVTVSGDYTTDF